MRGRPLAFLALVVSAWGAGRFVALMPENAIRPLTLVSEDMVVTSARADTVPGPVRPMVIPPIERAYPEVKFAAATLPVAPGRIMATTVAARAATMAQVATIDRSQPSAQPIVVPPGLPPAPAPRASPSRWTASAWAIARDGGGGSLLSPLLGGSQAGLRIAYRLDDDGRAAMFARATTPLNGGRGELAGGLQARPTRAPITVYAEVRAVRGDAAPAVGVFGGGALALPRDFRLEGYGQAGVIRRGGVSGFGDGQLRLVRVIDHIEIGAGAWAAAQRGASRLDVGPSLAVPIAVDPLAIRVTIDWRQRIAGNARPASGPAVSIGADF